MGYSAKILLDSISPAGNRLTTWELRYPRFIHSELMTHRVLSRNTASSRAIPTAKMREMILKDPVIPVHFGANQKGMQAVQEVADKEAALRWWMSGLDQAAKLHLRGEQLGIHKQIVNRVLEPWMYTTAIVSATEWGNLYHLRYHPDAQPEFQRLVKTMWPIYMRSEPQLLQPGEWHLPLINQDDIKEAYILGEEMFARPDELWCGFAAPGQKTMYDLRADAVLKMVSVGRCARVSYLNHDGVRSMKDDIALHDRLARTAEAGEPGHWSPFEHVATPNSPDDRNNSNFNGWFQYRKSFPKENLWQLPNLPYETEDADVLSM